MGEQPDDINPELLKESGRASAIQDLADQARRMGDRAEAWEISTREELIAQTKKDKRAKRWLGVALVVLAIGVWDGRQTAQDTQSLAKTNAEILEDVDALVAYVRRVEASRRSRGPQTEEVFQAILETRELICASSDPALQERCAVLGGEDTSGPEGGSG